MKPRTQISDKLLTKFHAEEPFTPAEERLFRQQLRECMTAARNARKQPEARKAYTPAIREYVEPAEWE